MSQHGCPERLSNRSKGFQEDGPSQPTMEVLVETLTGTAFEMTVSPSDTIFAIKSKIFRVEGIPVSQQHLLYNLKELDDSSCLGEHAIGDGARLRLVLGMCGGPITTRRLPPPPSAEPWRDIERLLDSNREDSDWGGNGCKVTVLVFREGERVNMLRVRENRDGTYSPLEHSKYSSSLTHLVEQEVEEGSPGMSGSMPVCGRDNAVTMAKMLELRRRMERLSVTRHSDRTDKPEIQKTRSEETLSTPSLLDEPEPFSSSFAHSFAYSDEEAFAPLYDGNYTRYDYDCSFAERYSLLPPIGSRPESEQAVPEAGDSDRLPAPLARGFVVQGEEAVVARHQQEPPHDLTSLPDTHYGPVVCGSSGWRASGFGSVSGLPGLSRRGGVGGVGGAGGGAAYSASSLHARASLHPPLSSSTPHLEQLPGNRILPALSRHRNREHLHLSDEGLHLPRVSEPSPPHTPPSPCPSPSPALASPSPAPAPPPPPPRGIHRIVEGGKPEDKPKEQKKIRLRCGFCKKRLTIATVHKCRCGCTFCAPHRYAEVHGCLYDYKALAAPAAPAPLPAHPKLPRI